jgi:hypothetical protein
MILSLGRGEGWAVKLVVFVMHGAISKFRLVADKSGVTGGVDPQRRTF